MDIVKRYFKFIMPLIDLAFVHSGYIIAFLFRFPAGIPEKYSNAYMLSAAVITIIYFAAFLVFRLYTSMWTLASIDELIFGVLGVIVGTVGTLLYSIASQKMLPLLVYFMAGTIITILVIGIRLMFRVYRRFASQISTESTSDYKRVLIVGAGSAGYMVLKEMQEHQELKYLPIAFVDDSVNKKGTIIGGVRVRGNSSMIPALVKKLRIQMIVIAAPSMSHKAKARIVEICSNTDCEVKIIPGVFELLEDKVTLSSMRDIDLRDLLGRETIKLDNKDISEYIEGQVVLVTGGGGSIGSELCRQIVNFHPRELIVLDIYENNAYELQNELLRNYPELNLKVVIASVRDRKRLEKIFNVYRPNLVFHAAAHKHVPLMEFSPEEAIKNNVLGTLNTAECADKYGVRRFVLISTDKAVNPTNVMGASKRICEMVIQAINPISKTEFVAVRFGNVLGSNGSVIPLFEKQIAEGGPVTVTHKNITRFFMLIPEAAQLVLQAGAYAKGGEIFVLDMGSPIRIYDMAKKLIRLSGHEPEVDIKIEVTGLRPGEKLYEELLMNEEGLENTKHEKIFIGKPSAFDFKELKTQILELLDLINIAKDDEEIIQGIESLVPTYKREKPAAEASAPKGDETWKADLGDIPAM